MASVAARDVGDFRASIDGFRREIDGGLKPQVQVLTKSYDTIIRSTERKARALAVEIERLRAGGAVISNGRLMRMERYLMLLDELRAQTIRYGLDVAAPNVAGLQAESVWLAQQHAARMEALTLGQQQAAYLGANFVQVNADAIQAISGTMGDGGTVRAYLLETLPEATVDAVGDALVEGIGAGLNPRVVARAAAKASGLGLHRALLIARTETMRAYRTSQQQRWESAGVVPAYRRTAALNDRTCLGCVAMDGTIFKMADELEDHPAGRCSMVPVFIANGEVIMPQMQSAQEWFAEQPEATQVGVMGPTRWAAWNDGRVELGQMARYIPNERFGGSWVPRTVADIQKTGGAGAVAATAAQARTVEQVVAA